jgi:trimeric autotransporter adhesin
VYVGGLFENATILTGGAALLSADDGGLQGALPFVDGRIDVAVPDGDGGFYIGGSFSQVGGKDRTRLARLRADGSLDPAWTPGVTSAVRALAFAGGRVYVGGSFEEAGGSGEAADSHARAFVAAFDADTGELDLDFDPSPSDTVRALVASGDRVVAAGQFDAWEGEARHRFAAFDADTGELDLDWDPGMESGRAETMAVSNGVVYVGGRFSGGVGGGSGGDPNHEHREGLAAFDAETGALLDWSPAADGDVNAIAIADGTVYVGGDFEELQSETAGGGTITWTRHHLAAIDAARRKLPIEAAWPTCQLAGGRPPGGRARDGVDRGSLSSVMVISADLQGNPNAPGSGDPRDVSQ